MRKEVEEDFRKSCIAASLMIVGAVVSAIGLFMLTFTLVHLLHWLTTPVPLRDPASIPLWGCYAIVTGLFVAVGGGMVFAGVKKFQSFNPLPDESAKALKDNVNWLVSQK